MPGKYGLSRNAPISDLERFSRFRDMARALGADDDPDEFDRAFLEVVSPAKTRSS